MYGIVNQAIQGLVTDNFGVESWSRVKVKANISEEYFLNNQLYEDNITYRLAVASAEVLDIPLTDVLVSFGKYWILKTSKEKYGTLIQSGGNSFSEFIRNLPDFHSRVMLIYAEIKPPEFIVNEITENEFILHYFSTRSYLTDFMLGLIHGLAELHNISIDVHILKDRRNGFDHDEFKVKVL